jgi:hypothetical protein
MLQRVAVWPWIGFTVWHLAPQVILSAHRRERSPGGVLAC